MPRTDRNIDVASVYKDQVAVERVIEQNPNISMSDLGKATGLPKMTAYRYRRVVEGRHSGLDPDAILTMRTKHRNRIDKQIDEMEAVLAEAIDNTRGALKPDYVGVAMLGKTLTGLYDHKTKFDGINAPKYAAFEDEIELFIREKAMTEEEAEEFRRIAIGDGKRRMLQG